MIVSPDGKILTDMGKDIGSATVELDPKYKYLRTAGYGGKTIRNDDFINEGLRPQVFEDN